MNSQELYNILQETTQVYRKGEKVQVREMGDSQVVEIFGYPHTSEAPEEEGYEKVDMIFVDVLVDKKKVTQRKRDLEKMIQEFWRRRNYTANWNLSILVLLSYSMKDAEQTLQPSYSLCVTVLL